MRDNDLVDKLIEYFDDIEDVKIISSKDFVDERDPYMVVIGIESKRQVYPTLPDYEYTISILIDTFITDDEKGKKVDEIKSVIESKLFSLTSLKKPLIEVFGNLPVVGIIPENITDSITNESNRSEMSYLIYTSF